MHTKALPTLAVLGCGTWGKNIIRTAADLGVLGAICDPFAPQGTLDSLSKKYKVPLLPLKAILESPAFDGAILATPTPTHYSLTKDILNAGKHVLIEKPMVKTIAEHEDIVSLSKKQGCYAMVGHLLLYHPAFTKVKSCIQDGLIGDVQFLHSHRTNLGRIYPYESTLWDLLPHDLSMILDIMQELPQRVLATEQVYLYEGMGDVATIELVFSNNRHAHIHESRLSPRKEQRLIVGGDKGMLTFDDTQEWQHKVAHNPSYVLPTAPIPQIHQKEEQHFPLPPAEPLRLELEHFINVITGTETLKTSAQSALDILKVILAAEASIRESRWVELDSPLCVPTSIAS